MSDNKPKVSVIIANYNHGQYIADAIDAIWFQTYPNLEIIVVDDCSTDDSKNIIEKCAEIGQCKAVCLPQNQGKWNALNKGIEQATGTLITTADSDDISLPHRIERQVECLLETKTYHNLCGFYHCWDDEAMKQENYEAEDQQQQKPQNWVAGKDVVNMVYTGWKTPGINHYFTGQFETHGSSALFYKQLWEFGMKFLPNDQGLLTLPADDADFNFKMTMLTQKTSLLLEKHILYRRNSSTNDSYKLGR